MTDHRGAYVEVECPHCQADFDIDVTSPETRWTCLSCGTEHRVGDVGQLCVPTDAGPVWWSVWQVEDDPQPAP